MTEQTLFVTTDGKTDQIRYMDEIVTIISLDDIKTWGKFLHGFGIALSFRSIRDEATELPDLIKKHFLMMRVCRPSISIDGAVTDWLDITPRQYKGIAGSIVSKSKQDGVLPRMMKGWRCAKHLVSSSELEAFLFVCCSALVFPNYNIGCPEEITVKNNGCVGEFANIPTNHVWTDASRDEVVDFSSAEIEDGISAWDALKDGFVRMEVCDIRDCDIVNANLKKHRESVREELGRRIRSIEYEKKIPKFSARDFSVEDAISCDRTAIAEWFRLMKTYRANFLGDVNGRDFIKRHSGIRWETFRKRVEECLA